MPTTPLPDAPADLLYEQIAQRIIALINGGTLRVGQRVPSVRKLSEQMAISVSTVLQAYRLLERRGRIEARPQSGYYVRAVAHPRLPTPGLSKPPSTPTKVRIVDRVLGVLRATSDPSYVPLGGAIPGADVLPTKQLNRIQSAIARRSPRASNAYDGPSGNRELRVQVAHRYLDAGCALAPDDIVSTCGCQEAITLSLRVVAKAGDVIAIDSPAYYGHLQAIESLGMRALEIATCPDVGIDVPALKTALAQHKVAAVLSITNCQNPLGFIMPDEQKRELVELLAARDIPLIEDDIFGDLAYARPRPRVCKAYDTKGLVLLCSSYSKTLAPGARVGWVAPGRYRERVECLKICTTLATPTLPQMAIAEFLANGGYDQFLRRACATYAEQTRLVSQAVRKYFPTGTKVTDPAGGYVLWVEMPPGTDALALHERALKEKINVAPGPIFSSKGKYANFVRINCGNPYTDEIDRALLTLGRLASDLSHSVS
jgi:DNA-binding transcriptional MocR family regulator